MLCTTGLIIPTMAQTPAAEVASKSTNDLAITALTHFKNVFKAASTATDKAAAEKAAASIHAEVAKITALEPLLAKAAKPTDADMQAMANKMVAFEGEMAGVMQKMMQNMMAGGADVQNTLKPAMEAFQAKAQTVGKTMETLYPQEKMKPLIVAAKAKAAAGSPAPAKK